MIEVESLCRHYGDTAAVENRNFRIGTGEIVGLLGHNGAGKTTLMRRLCGYLEPSAGKITVNGIDVTENPRAMQQHLGYLPENLLLYPNMTVAEYLAYMTVQSLGGDSTLALYTLGNRQFIKSSEDPWFFILRQGDYRRLTAIDIGLISGETRTREQGHSLE